jgi:hypothetical protein
LRPTPVLLAALALAAGATGCGESQQPIPPTAVGVITEIDGEGSAVTSFTLETQDDGTFEVFIAEDVDYGFDLAHLHEHETTGDPVRCTLEDRDGRAYALAIVDA